MYYKGKKVWLDKKGYACVWMDGKTRKLHVIVWEIANGKKPSGIQIHHKDGNKANYKLSNLEPVNQSDHLRIHAGWVRENNEWVSKPCSGCQRTLPLSDFYPRKTVGTPTALCKSCHSKSINSRKDDVWREKNRVYQREWAREKRHAIL